MPAWFLAGWVADRGIWIFHFEPVFTRLFDVNLCFSKAVALASSLAGWLSGWLASSAGCVVLRGKIDWRLPGVFVVILRLFS